MSKARPRAEKLLIELVDSLQLWIMSHEAYWLQHGSKRMDAAFDAAREWRQRHGPAQRQGAHGSGLRVVVDPNVAPGTIEMQHADGRREVIDLVRLARMVERR